MIEEIDASTVIALEQRLERIERQINLLLNLKRAEATAAGSEAPDNVLSIAQAGAILDRSRGSIYKYIEEGRLRKYLDDKGKPFFYKSEVLKLQQEIAGKTKVTPSQLLQSL